MADYFGYNTSGVDASSVLTFDNAKLQINGGTAALVQDMTIQYSQQVSPIYEIGSNKVYYVQGHPSGTGSINRIISNKNKDDFDEYGNICNAKTVTISAASSTCTDATPLKLTLEGFIVTGVTFTMRAGDATIREGVSFMFASLKKN